MWPYEILYYTQFISATVVFLTALILAYKIFRAAMYIDGLIKKVYHLGKGITSENVKDYIAYLDTKYTPFRFYTTNIIKAGYKLVEMNEDIDSVLKLRLKIIILSKGLLVD